MAYRQDEDQPGEGDAAAEAFEALRGELALMRRAVERLAAERGEQPEPVDYTETLAAIMQNITATAHRADKIMNSPALAVSHAQIMSQMAQASEKVRQDALTASHQAGRSMDEAVQQLRTVVASAREARMQWLMLAGAVVGGVLLWATAGGAVLRAAPADWQWPEKAAARLLRLPMWEAGMELAAKGEPEAFRRVGAADRLVKANAKSIEACRKKAAKRGQAVQCAVEVEAAARH